MAGQSVSNLDGAGPFSEEHHKDDVVLGTSDCCFDDEVSQYTGRIHLCTCEDGEDSAVKSLSENFRVDEITVKSIEMQSDIIKRNPGFHFAMMSFIEEWTSLKCMDQKKLFGKPLQLPLAICCVSLKAWTMIAN